MALSCVKSVSGRDFSPNSRQTGLFSSTNISNH
jgi:hypothetical protein